MVSAPAPIPEAGLRLLLRRAGPLLLVVGSAFTSPLLTVGGVTLTGDRVLGLLAVVAVAGLRVPLMRGPIHVALAVFVGVQIATSVLAANAWPQGLKFVSVYVLGFACFALAAEWARGAEGTRRSASAWITVGAVLGAWATVAAILSALFQAPVWGAAFTGRLPTTDGTDRFLYAGKATFNEWNLLSSFLLVSFALSLWSTRGEADGRTSDPTFRASRAGIVGGLVFGLTRAAWIGMGGLAALWLVARRPRWRQLGALLLMIALGFLIQAAAIGASPLRFRVVDAIRTGHDKHLEDRVTIGARTIASWRTGEVFGHGAGSINGVRMYSIVRRPAAPQAMRPWTGNLVLFVLHDSGLVGLVALLGVLAVVARKGWAAVAGAAGRAAHPLALPLLGVGVVLLFAYQFTHGLWIMYPYVYLGLLTAVLDASPESEPERTQAA